MGMGQKTAPPQGLSEGLCPSPVSPALAEGAGSSSLRLPWGGFSPRSPHPTHRGVRSPPPQGLQGSRLQVSHKGQEVSLLHGNPAATKHIPSCTYQGSSPVLGRDTEVHLSACRLLVLRCCHLISAGSFQASSSELSGSIGAYCWMCTLCNAEIG